MNNGACKIMHIDPREGRNLGAEKEKEMRELASLMRKSGSNPYRYIRRAFKCFGEGDLDRAYEWVNYAADMAQFFWPEKAIEADLFRKEVNLIRFTIIFLDQKFSTLPREAG